MQRSPPRPLVRAALLVVLPVLGACKQPMEDTATVEPGLGFDEATLSPAFEHRTAVWAGAALLDYDLDGWLDIYFAQGRNHPDALYRNLGDGSFVDVAAEAGVAIESENGSVVAGDLDNDGDPDLIVSQACSTGTFSDSGAGVCDGGKTLFFNQGDGTFTEVPLDVSLETDKGAMRSVCCTVSMGLFDVDLDGDLDLALSQGGDPDVETPWQFRKNRQEGAANFTLLNDGDGGFDDAVPFMDVHDHNARITFTTASFDVDGDGVPDLLRGQAGHPVDLEIRRTDELAYDRIDESDASGDGLWMGLAVADYDADGDFDIYGTNQGLSTYLQGYDNTELVNMITETEWINTYHSLLLNDGGALVPTSWPVEADQTLAGDLFEGFDDDTGYEMADGLQRYGWGWGAVPLDIDADGWMDVAFTGNNCSMPMDIIWTEDNGAGPGGLLRNDGGAGFADITWEAGVANVDEQGRYPDGRGLVTGDLNNDGYADLVYVNRSYNPTQNDPLAQEVGKPRIWLSQPRAGHWLQVDPVGSESNRDGIGATLEVVADGETRLYLLGAGGETNSSSERLFTVGLGEATTADLTLTFPSGQTVVRAGVAADQRLVLDEGT